jgi:hypothetical protein
LGRHKFLLLIALFFILPGCTGMLFSSEQARKKEFEGYWNSQIGKQLNTASYFKEVIEDARDVDEKTIEFILKQKYRCRIAVSERKKGHEVVSWRYITDPELCWVYMPSAW